MVLSEPIHSKEGRNEVDTAFPFVSGLWADLGRQSKRLGQIHIQASEVSLSVARRVKRPSATAGAFPSAVALKPAPRTCHGTPRALRYLSGCGSAGVQQTRQSEDFILPSYITELQQDSRAGDEEDAPGPTAIPSESAALPSPGSRDAIACEHPLALLDVDGCLGAVSFAVPLLSSSAALHSTVPEDRAPPSSPRLGVRERGSPPLVQLVEMIPQHYPSDLLWVHPHVMVPAPQVRWDSRDGRGKLTPIRADLMPPLRAAPAQQGRSSSSSVSLARSPALRSRPGRFGAQPRSPARKAASQPCADNHTDLLPRKTWSGV